MTIEPDTTTPAAPPRTRKWLVPAIIGVLAVVAAAVAIPLTITLTQPSTFTASGTFMLNGATNFTGSGAACAGTGGYSDLGAGADVNVYDEAGKLVGNSKLNDGTPRQGACVFSFTVPSIPSGSKLYQIEISHRGKLTQSEQDLVAGVELTIGS